MVSTSVSAQKTVSTPLSAYVEGRSAEARGDAKTAAMAYSNALSVEPKNMALAVRAYRQAMSAGNRALALRAAYALDRGSGLTADARVLLYLDAISRNDWQGARLRIDAIEEQASFDFLVPTLRAWVTFAARDGDAIQPLAVRAKSNLTELYSREHRALLRAALKQNLSAVTTVNEIAGDDQRGLSLRLAVAAQMVAAKDKASALAVLVHPNAVLFAARERVERGGKLPDAVDNIHQATGILLARIAADLLRDNAPAPALTVARLAIFAAAQRDESQLTLAQSLTAAGRHDEALVILSAIDSLSPIASLVRTAKMETLLSAGRMNEALDVAKAESVGPNADVIEFMRLGEVYTQLNLHAEAASAYERAITLASARRPDHPGLKGLWLRYGAALDRAGEWKRAKPALEHAVMLAPNQVSALNHLGYAMLEHSDDIATATKLIAKASALSPDDPQIADSLGWALFKQNQIEEAIAVLERAVAKAPREAAIGDHLGDAYWKAGRRVDARYAWGAALTQADLGDVKRIESKIANGLLPAVQ